jgi:hypothetical protein
MILDKKDRYIKEEQTYYDHPFGWVGAGAGGGQNPIDQVFKENRHKIEIIGGVVDHNLSYEYDEFALVRWKSKLYLLETSGCSCPSPDETWGTVHGPITKTELTKEIKAGNYTGYTLPAHLEQELLEVIEAA